MSKKQNKQQVKFTFDILNNNINKLNNLIDRFPEFLYYHHQNKNNTLFDMYELRSYFEFYSWKIDHIDTLPKDTSIETLKNYLIHGDQGVSKTDKRIKALSKKKDKDLTDLLSSPRKINTYIKILPSFYPLILKKYESVVSTDLVYEAPYKFYFLELPEYNENLIKDYEITRMILNPLEEQIRKCDKWLMHVNISALSNKIISSICLKILSQVKVGDILQTRYDMHDIYIGNIPKGSEVKVHFVDFNTSKNTINISIIYRGVSGYSNHDIRNFESKQFNRDSMIDLLMDSEQDADSK